ncbi:hypothetical protein L1281_000237 [Neisseria sp. HSC-16F19]|nr:hypothetical protein [Neisseria sp. HSC-16F19]MCP2039667.1 hypothetical protein [Neisseria sp. HSC-16F19]
MPTVSPQPFAVTLYGTADGPLPQHRAVAERLPESIPAAQQQAADDVLALLAESGLVPDEVVLNRDNLWSYLTPEWLVLTDFSYFGNGKDMMVHVGFITPWYEDAGVQLLLKNGVDYEGLGTE